MATYQQNLLTTRDNIGAILAEISADPKPSYSLDGESYSWSEYFAMLTTQLKGIEEAIQRSQAPFARHSRGRA